MKRILGILALMLLGVATAYAQPTGWDGVEKAFGRKGAAQGDMYKITFPRSDLKVLIG